MEGHQRVSITNNPVEHRRNIRWALAKGWRFVSVSEDADGTLYANFIESE